MRRCSVCVAILALLYGCATTPYTHAHQNISSVVDDHHPRGGTLVHTHARPHAGDHDQDAGPGGEDGDSSSPERVWSIATFVAQHATTSAVPIPLLIEYEIGSSPAEHVTLCVDRDRPRAHGPPVIPLSSLRAPPAVPPTSI